MLTISRLLLLFALWGIVLMTDINPGTGVYADDDYDLTALELLDLTSFTEECLICSKPLTQNRKWNDLRRKYFNCGTGVDHSTELCLSCVQEKACEESPCPMCRQKMKKLRPTEININAVMSSYGHTQQPESMLSPCIYADRLLWNFRQNIRVPADEEFSVRILKEAYVNQVLTLLREPRSEECLVDLTRLGSGMVYAEVEKVVLDITTGLTEDRLRLVVARQMNDLGIHPEFLSLGYALAANGSVAHVYTNQSTDEVFIPEYLPWAFTSETLDLTAAQEAMRISSVRLHSRFSECESLHQKLLHFLRENIATAVLREVLFPHERREYFSNECAAEFKVVKAARSIHKIHRYEDGYREIRRWLSLVKASSFLEILLFAVSEEGQVRLVHRHQGLVETYPSPLPWAYERDNSLKEEFAATESIPITKSMEISLPHYYHEYGRSFTPFSELNIKLEEWIRIPRFDVKQVYLDQSLFNNLQWNGLNTYFADDNTRREYCRKVQEYYDRLERTKSHLLYHKKGDSTSRWLILKQPPNELSLKHYFFAVVHAIGISGKVVVVLAGVKQEKNLQPDLLLYPFKASGEVDEDFLSNTQLLEEIEIGLAQDATKYELHFHSDESINRNMIEFIAKIEEEDRMGDMTMGIFLMATNDFTGRSYRRSDLIANLLVKGQSGVVIQKLVDPDYTKRYVIVMKYIDDYQNLPPHFESEITALNKYGQPIVVLKRRSIVPVHMYAAYPRPFDDNDDVLPEWENRALHYVIDPELDDGYEYLDAGMKFSPEEAFNSVIEEFIKQPKTDLINRVFDAEWKQKLQNVFVEMLENGQVTEQIQKEYEALLNGYIKYFIMEKENQYQRYLLIQRPESSSTFSFGGLNWYMGFAINELGKVKAVMNLEAIVLENPDSWFIWPFELDEDQSLNPMFTARVSSRRAMELESGFSFVSSPVDNFHFIPSIHQFIKQFIQTPRMELENEKVITIITYDEYVKLSDTLSDDNLAQEHIEYFKNGFITLQIEKINGHFYRRLLVLERKNVLHLHRQFHLQIFMICPFGNVVLFKDTMLEWGSPISSEALTAFPFNTSTTSSSMQVNFTSIPLSVVEEHRERFRAIEEQQQPFEFEPNQVHFNKFVEAAATIYDDVVPTPGILNRVSLQWQERESWKLALGNLYRDFDQNVDMELVEKLKDLQLHQESIENQIQRWIVLQYVQKNPFYRQEETPLIPENILFSQFFSLAEDGKLQLVSQQQSITENYLEAYKLPHEISSVTVEIDQVAEIKTPILCKDYPLLHSHSQINLLLRKFVHQPYIPFKAQVTMRREALEHLRDGSERTRGFVDVLRYNLPRLISVRFGKQVHRYLLYPQHRNRRKYQTIIFAFSPAGASFIVGHRQRRPDEIYSLSGVRYPFKPNGNLLNAFKRNSVIRTATSVAIARWPSLKVRVSNLQEFHDKILQVVYGPHEDFNITQTQVMDLRLLQSIVEDSSLGSLRRAALQRELKKINHITIVRRKADTQIRHHVVIERKRRNIQSMAFAIFSEDNIVRLRESSNIPADSLPWPFDAHGRRIQQET